jgi:hypothetical protein
MFRRIFNILTVAALLFFGVLAILAAPSFFDPAFEIVNESSAPVFVVAEWRNEEKRIGNIAPMSVYAFSVDAEAAMKFRVSYPGGGEVESEPIYFTSGTKVIATITSNAVRVRYDHET